ncbi:hypothetical protein MAR_022786 [Mya arenaria]|uniref:Uncharacterized protein n=1 Tax=Mya arenaria TaxID=6604 RepID=A0ABY7DQN1_MYAAR|nr:hypothetical protein MAR_022786 [Mya arenaria]
MTAKFYTNINKDGTVKRVAVIYVLVPLLQREAETVERQIQLQPFLSQLGQCIDPFENAQQSITLCVLTKIKTHLVLRFSFTKKLTPRGKISSRSNLCKLSCIFNY